MGTLERQAARAEAAAQRPAAPPTKQKRAQEAAAAQAAVDEQFEGPNFDEAPTLKPWVFHNPVDVGNALEIIDDEQRFEAMEPQDRAAMIAGLKGWERSMGQGSLEQARTQTEGFRFEQANVDTSELPSYYEEKRQKREADKRYYNQSGLPKLENLPPDHIENVRREQERQGIDVHSGYGEDLVDVMHAAVQFDSPKVQGIFMEGQVRDDLEKAGIQLPDNYRPIKYNEDLNQVMFLRPVEGTGKARWTVAEPATFRPQDFGKLVDPSETLSAAGAMAGVIFGKNTFAGEWAGDVVGRNLGLAIEALVSHEDITMEDYKNAVKGTFISSTIETIAGRTFGRLVAPKKTLIGQKENLRVLEQNIAETSEAVDTINKLTNREVVLAPSEVADSTAALIQFKGKEGSASTATRQGLEEVRQENAMTINEANNKIHGVGDGTMSPDYDPYAVQGPLREMNERLEAEVAAHGEIVLQSSKVDPIDGTEKMSYKFVHGGELPAKVADEFGGKRQVGVEVVYNHATQTARLENAFAGSKSPGETVVLLNRAYRDVIASGYTPELSASISKQARNSMERLEAMGWSFRKNPNARVRKDGTWYTDNGEPAAFIDGVPGDVVLTTPYRNDGFDRMNIELALNDVEQGVAAMATYSDSANKHLMETIGWSQQRRVSKYHIKNPSSTGLRGQVRAMTNRVEQALSGPDVSAAEKNLGAVMWKHTDGEGEEFLAGLASDALDVGNLLRARDSIWKIADETGDPDMIRMGETIDNLLKNGKYYTEKGNQVAVSTRSRINDAFNQADKAQAALERHTSFVNAQTIFKKNANGEYMYTTQKDWETLLKGGSKFMKDLKPVLDGSPQLMEEAQSVLRGLYRDEVMPDGVWSRKAHDQYMSKYRTALEHVSSPEDLDALARYDLTGNAKQPWDQFVARQEENSKRAARAMGFGTGKPPPSPIDIKPEKIIDSLRKNPNAETFAYIRWTQKNAPETFAQLQKQAMEQVRLDLHNKWLSPKITKGGSQTKSISLSKWYQDNKKILGLMFGDEYVSNLGAVVTTVDATTRRFRVKGVKDDPQTLFVRSMRSVIGPLTKPQRMISAAEFAKLRTQATAAMKLLTSPEAMSEIMLATRKGLDLHSQAGVALFSRLGFFAEFGIVGDPNDPEYLQAARALWGVLESDADEADAQERDRREEEK